MSPCALSKYRCVREARSKFSSAEGRVLNHRKRVKITSNEASARVNWDKGGKIGISRGGRGKEHVTKLCRRAGFQKVVAELFKTTSSKGQIGSPGPMEKEGSTKLRTMEKSLKG